MTKPTRLDPAPGVDTSALVGNNDARVPVLYVPPAALVPTRHTITITEDPMAQNDKVNITIVHPTESGEEVSVAVSAAATPKFLVDQLLKAGFMPAIAETEGRYDLNNLGTGAQIGAGSTLAAAGIADGARLKLMPALNGAVGVAVAK
jgi:hypothetical protein